MTISDPSGWHDAQRISRQAVEQAIVEYAPAVVEECALLELDPHKLLTALAAVESTLGEDLDRGTWKIKHRHEASYAVGGRWYDQDLTAHWGKAAECSWGPWQIMYANAHRFGFPIEIDPADEVEGLVDVRTAAEISTRMLAHELRKVLHYRSVHPEDKATPLEMIADTWNTGGPEGKRPAEYIAKVVAAYAALH